MKSLKTAIVGCGNIAGGYDETPGSTGTWSHAKAYQAHGGFSLAAAYDPRQKRLSEFCSRWRVPDQAKDLADLLQRFSPEVVSICSPNETHFDFLLQALSTPSVKGIWCEKPLTLSLAQAKQVEKVAKIPVLVNYLRRWDRRLCEIGARIQKDEFGKISGGRVLYTKGVFHNASHAINLLQHWLGPVSSVEVAKVHEHHAGDLTADFTLVFGNSRIHFQALDHRNFNHFEIEIFTELALLRFPGGATVEIQKRAASKIAAGEFNLGAVETLAPTISTAMEEVAANFYEAIETVAICERIKENNG
jgi:predicted dehydrogenase